MERGKARAVVEERLRDRLREAGLEGGRGFLVAYSAGPDSSALLAAAAALGLPGLAAAYVDHGIRPLAEREAELALARRACARLGLPLCAARVRPGAVLELARSEGLGVEAAARRFRYRALLAIMDRRGSRCVLTAHCLDDQLETILMRLLGGSGSGGLRGIPRRNGPFLRPLLDLRKSELAAYAEARGLEYSIDSTNASRDYARNRARLDLVPALDRSFHGWARGLLLASRKAELEDEALSRAAAGLAFSLEEGGRSARAPAAPLVAAPRALALRALVEASGLVLRAAPRPRGGGARGERASARLALAALDALSRGSSHRAGGLAFALEGDSVVISPCLDFPGRGGYFVLIEGPGTIRAGGLVVSASWSPDRGIRADAFDFPLVVRSRRPGDEIALPGGTKRLDVLLSEMSLPSDERDRVPVAEDRRGIVALLGGCLGSKDRYRRGPSLGDPPRLAIDVKGA